MASVPVGRCRGGSRTGVPSCHGGGAPPERFRRASLGMVSILRTAYLTHLRLPVPRDDGRLSNLPCKPTAPSRPELSLTDEEGRRSRMTTRRLAAILAADVVGFSSMMERNEEGTVARLKALQRDLLEPRVRAHHGRIVKTTGDGFLVEFASPLEAVRCALGVQEDLARNGPSGAPEEPLRLRIGITLGDIIIQDDGDIYGEGVNVATRLEQLAEPGGLCVSGKVHDEVEGKIAVPWEEHGEYQVKNISRPVRVFAAPRSRGAMPAGATASAAHERTAALARI